MIEIPLPQIHTHEDLIALAKPYANEEGTILLLSGGQQPSAKASYLFLFPVEKKLVNQIDNPWEALPQEHSSSPWVGYLTYEMGLRADRDSLFPLPEHSLPLACFYRHSCYVRLDHREEKAILVIEEKQSLSLKDFQMPPLPHHPHIASLKLLSQSDTKKQYIEKIEQIKEWIRAGEMYQVNLSQEFVFEGPSHPFDCFHLLQRFNPAPFSAYVKTKQATLVSSSPERLLLKQGNRLETRPIKGTAPRGKTPSEDRHHLQQLLSSVKERAELLMITDLMRNDLGKVAKVGTVEVKELYRVEAYANVFHLLSVIEAEVENHSPLELLRAVFPGGSITGCPKLRAMQAIQELEKRPRGIYTGSIGYFSNEDFDFNIAIRTLFMQENRVHLHLGSAIVIDSDPEPEYEETLHKGKTLFRVLGNTSFV